jgi:hypothetical protein
MILPGEANLTVVEPDQATVGDGDAVSVAAEISEHLVGRGKRRFGVDDPVDLVFRFEPSTEGGGVGQARKRAGKTKFAVGEDGAPLAKKLRHEVPERQEGGG